MFSALFGSSKPPRATSDNPDPPVSKGFFGTHYGPREKFTKAEIKKLNRHYAKRINKRDLSYQEFVNLPDWNQNPLVPRALEVLNKDVRNSTDLSKSPLLHLQDFINVYEKLRNYQTQEDKMKFAFQLLDYDEDGGISESDLTHFYVSVTGLSEDAARYHARDLLDGRSFLSEDDFNASIPLIQFCARFDLPQPAG
ncbi:unnamed protein product [Amoebophrya sp. A120]|nr:unnamed protein product [Amoebophrya sp. A120]|eukprot:GSA120T00008462001.1